MCGGLGGESMAARRVCAGCGEVYNTAYIKEGQWDMPPMLPRACTAAVAPGSMLAPEVGIGPCDKCGGHDIVQRKDDREAVCRARLLTYHEETRPLVDIYTERGLVHTFTIDGGTKQCMPRLAALFGRET